MDLDRGMVWCVAGREGRALDRALQHLTWFVLNRASKYLT